MNAIIAIGVPGIGKSTYLRDFARTHHSVYLSSDKIRHAFTGSTKNTDSSMEVLVWQHIYEDLAKKLKTNDVILDANNLDPVKRRSLIAHLRAAGAQRVEAFWFCRPLVLAISQNATRSKPVDEQEIQKKYAYMLAHPPTVAEGFDEIIAIR